MMLALMLIFLTDMSVFGLTLGRPVTLPRCTDTAMLVKSPCVQDELTIVFPILDKPEMMKYHLLGTVVIDGKLEGVNFLTNGLASQEADLNRLKEKYGEPSSSTSRPIQNLMGAEAHSIEAVWSLPDLKVSFAGTFGRMDRGRVFIETPKGFEKRRNEEKAKDKRPL